MEKNQTQFLTDILAQIQAMKKQIEQLESQVAEYISTEEIAEKDLTDENEEDLPEEEPVTLTITDDLPQMPEEEDLPDTETYQTEQKCETVTEPTLLDEDEDLPEDDSSPEEKEKEPEVKGMPKIEDTQKAENAQDVVDLKIDDDFEVLPLGEALAPAKDAVMDKMAEKESWRTDMPGSSVNDIRSAISLNDRILFINTLFHEDPIAFKDTLSELNAMPSFEEGARYLKDNHPEWNTESEVVYRFMMAVRRKLK